MGDTDNSGIRSSGNDVVGSNTGSKICLDCEIEKPLGSFGFDYRQVDGKKYICLKCQDEWEKYSINSSDTEDERKIKKLTKRLEVKIKENKRVKECNKQLSLKLKKAMRSIAAYRKLHE